MKDNLVTLIVQATREILEAEGETVPDLKEDTKLFGREGVLDSMALVSLIVAVEQEIEDEFESSVALADERALSQSSSPYRTIGTLAEYAADQLQGVG